MATERKTTTKRHVAKVIPIKPVTSWSFSRYQDYLTCPLKFALKHIDRIKEPGNEAMTRGAEIHTTAEYYIKGLIPAKIPEALEKHAVIFRALRKRYAKQPDTIMAEDMWSFDKDWNESAWDDWNNCVLRIKLDCAYEEKKGQLIIVDWKTGKYRSEQNEAYLEQLELYALAALIRNPEIKEVLPRLVYLDLGITYPAVNKPLIFTQADVPRLKALWAKRTVPMMNDKIFAPRPNQFCRWCWFRKENTPNLPNQKQLCEY